MVTPAPVESLGYASLSHNVRACVRVIEGKPTEWRRMFEHLQYAEIQTRQSCLRGLATWILAFCSVFTRMWCVTFNPEDAINFSKENITLDRSHFLHL